MTGPISDPIWRDIDKSGVELELRVVEIFKKFDDWDVTPNSTFVDLEGKKGREVDLEADLEVEVETPNFVFFLDVELRAECKKIPGNSWTFFPSTPKENQRTLRCVDFSGYGARTGRAWDTLDNPFRESIVPDAESQHYREAVLDKKRSNGRTDNLYKGAMTVAKATELAYRDSQTSAKENLEQEALDFIRTGMTPAKTTQEKRYVDFSSFLPALLVFDGEMFVADLQSRKIIEAKLVRLYHSYKSGKYDIKNLPIDVCKVSYLPEYLQKLTAVLKQFSTIVKGHDFRPEYHAKYDSAKTWMENRRQDWLDNVFEKIKRM